MAIAFGKLSSPVKATIYVLLAMLCFSALAVLIRLATDALHVAQVMFFRNFFGVLLLLPFLARYGLRALSSHHMGMHTVRALLGFAAMFTGFTAITLIPLAEATALNFTMPLFATIGAVLVLGERIRIHRITALVVGFAGVIFVLRPGAEAISFGAMLAIAGAAFIAASSVVAKQLTDWERPFGISLWMVIIQTPISFVLAMFFWEWPNAQELAWVFAIAAIGSVAHLLWVNALAIAEVSQLQPFEFIRLPIVSFVAFLLFDETTTAWIWVGGALIVASTAYIARREAQLDRRLRLSREAGAAHPPV